ncbi:class I SAM-dependent methyltransferase [Corynebacterium neomassiliense]|uniref:class I SAM-dependent methyltransferase n=1 Tax=Corynebacterium neomassiliense TaxID=2079482 RepID=UPI001031E2C8|nr:class I SAM-dependent methyltransferase [Corynebacterium neomassiliense]
MSSSRTAFTPLTVGQIVEKCVAPPMPFRVTAFDGSTAGPEDAPLHLDITSPDALAYAVTAPGDLGLARAYITGGLRVSGEHPGHPVAVFDHLQHLYGQFHRPTASDTVAIARSLKRLGAFRFQPAPAQETLPGWKRALLEGLSRHSRERDKEVVSRHYDVGNDFYELFLGDSMAYTCAYYPEDEGLDNIPGPYGDWNPVNWPKGGDANAPLTAAQDNKHRLVFDKLRLKPGDRLLDVGCGWGGMVRYAARHGVKALGVTLSQEQYEWGRAKIEEEGLQDLAEVRCMDYRDIRETKFDAVSAIGILEHIGVQNYGAYFSFLYGKLRPGGRMLNHCITRPNNVRTKTGQFIDRYIFPDGELTGSGRIITIMQDAGFDVVHEEDLRPNYQRTLHDWCELLVANWDEAVALVGEPTARLFGLYMAGAEWHFEHNKVQLHQVLGVKPDEDGFTGVPTRQWWRP